MARVCVRIQVCVLGVFSLTAATLAEPPREIRIGSFAGADGAGVVFRANRPEYMGDDVWRAGDVNGDGLDDFLIRRYVANSGDVNRDSRVDLSDPVSLLGSLFLGDAPPSCADSADANDDGKLDLSDAIYVLAHLFLGGPPPPPPFPSMGGDPTPDALDC